MFVDRRVWAKVVSSFSALGDDSLENPQRLRAAPEPGERHAQIAPKTRKASCPGIP